MATTNSWAHSRIIIKDPDSDQTLVDTDIQDCDYTAGWIWVEAPNTAFEIGKNVNALIISENSLEECQCVIRNIFNYTTLQLAIYRRINKEDSRAHQRYNVSLPGIVRNIWAGGQMVKKTKNVFSITIINMSSSGILFQSPKGQFDIKDTFDISVRIDSRQLLISGIIVRIQNTEAKGLNEECAAQIYTVKYT